MGVDEDAVDEGLGNFVAYFFKDFVHRFFEMVEY